MESDDEKIFSTLFGDLEDDPKNLSERHYDRLVALFESVVSKKKPCELCGNDDWSFNSRLVSPTMIEFDFEKGTTAIDNSVAHPCAFLQCLTCGNSKFLSLTVLGFEPNKEKADE